MSGKRKRSDGFCPPNKAIKLTSAPHHRGDLRCNDADWHAYVNHRPSELNITPWMKKVRQMGFDDIYLHGPRMGDLTNAIHPVFAPANFPLEDFVSNPTSDLWKTLEPALRLASRMLTSKAALAFFRRLRFGLETDNPETNTTYFEYSEPPQHDRDLQEKTIQHDLQVLSRRIQWLFCAYKPDINASASEAEDHVHAITLMSQDWFGKKIFFRGDVSKLPSATSGNLYVALNYAYREYAEHTTCSKNTACAYARFAHSFAFTVVHEVAHAYFAHHTKVDHEEWNEPLIDLLQHDGGDLGELGLALELALFRDSIKTIIHPQDGITMQSEPVTKGLVSKSVVHVDGHLIFPVDPVWLHSLLTTEFWDLVDHMDDQEQLQALYIQEVQQGICITMDEHRNEQWGWRQATHDKRDEEQRRRAAAAQSKGERTRKGNKAKKPQNSVTGRTGRIKRKANSNGAPKSQPAPVKVPVIEDYEAYDQKMLADAVKQKQAELNGKTRKRGVKGSDEGEN